VNYSHEDEARIIEKFKENTTITSDPFILVAKKLKGRE